jgi:hypothetical protein
MYGIVVLSLHKLVPCSPFILAIGLKKSRHLIVFLHNAPLNNWFYILLIYKDLMRPFSTWEERVVSMSILYMIDC